MQIQKNEPEYNLSFRINLFIAWKQTTRKHTNCDCSAINASISITICIVQCAYWINSILCYWLHEMVRFNGITLLFNLPYITYERIESVINWNELNRWLNKKRGFKSLPVGIFTPDGIHLFDWGESGSMEEFYM